MNYIICPYCRKELGAFNKAVEKAQGSVKCPKCNETFGWSIRINKIVYIW